MRFLPSNSYDVVMVDGKPKELGQGGMAVVYLANDLALGTQVAIKVLKSHLLSHVQIRNKFLKEGRSLFQMSHPHVVRVYNIIDQPDCAALVMEYIEGETLRQKIARQGRFSDEEVKLHLEQLLQALEYVHDQQIIHRDIKSGNIMIDKQGQIKLLDFGIAKSINPNDTESTAMGLMSPLWASPEQLNGQKLTISTDIYSAGMVLWEMASGQRPWNLNNPSLETLVEHVCKRPLPELDCSWDEQIQIATAKNPSGRYSSAQRWLDAIHGMQNLDRTIEVPRAEHPKNQSEGPAAAGTAKLPEIEWVSIPAGTFTMGSKKYERERNNNEGPSHQVTLSAFKMSKHAVTFAQYDAFCEATGSQKPNDNGWGRGNRPVINVDWHEACAFAKWMGCRLPTEAEWEYACRAGTTTRFNTGDSLDFSQGNFEGQIGRQTMPVGSYAANPWGLFDMHGNVYEWCSDWFGAYSDKVQTNPIGPPIGTKRVLRGGSWNSYGKYCRSANRHDLQPYFRFDYVGFRLVFETEVTVGNETEHNSEGRENPSEGPAEAGTAKLPEIEWMPIPAGTFNMGSGLYEWGRQSHEGPAHQVTLGAFEMSKYPVTFDQYDAFCDATGRPKPDDNYWGRGKRPVIHVDWNDANAFAEWMGCRLPTEAEWEYACRAGTTTRFNTGWLLNANQANFDENLRKTNPVGTYTPNAWGLYDMHGNVWEWCSDWFGMYSSSAQTNPKGPSSGLDRVLRGGGWYNNGRYCRSAHRERSLPSGRYNRVGFRLVKGAQKEADDKTVPISDKTKNPGILESDLILVVIGLIAFFTVLALVTNSFKSNQTGSIDSGIDSSSYFGFNATEEEPLIDSDYWPPIEWVSIPAGTFTMGSPSYETDRKSDEAPQHTVTLSGFKMSKYEVSFAQYDAFCDATGRQKPSDEGWGRGNRPVINVGWNDASAFAEWMNCRLPTEAEWEYACRAGCTTPFNTASSLTSGQANFNTNVGKTMPVGFYSPNAWGLYDMHGNVHEWCSDWYGSYSNEFNTDPIGASNGSFRVLRGGSWNSLAQFCRSACRGQLTATHRISTLGFRVVSLN